MRIYGSPREGEGRRGEERKGRKERKEGEENGIKGGEGERRRERERGDYCSRTREVSFILPCVKSRVSNTHTQYTCPIHMY